MKTALFTALLAGALALGGCQTNASTPDEVMSARQETRDLATNTLARLDQLKPGARRAVQSAHAYAVITNFGLKIFLVGGGSGRGIAVRQNPHQEVYMRMAEVQAGLGLGVQDCRLVWVFTNEAAYNEFVTRGLTIGADASAQAITGDVGAEAFAGAVLVKPGVYLYQITDNGLALELVVKGTKYYRDEPLN